MVTLRRLFCGAVISGGILLGLYLLFSMRLLDKTKMTPNTNESYGDVVKYNIRNCINDSLFSMQSKFVLPPRNEDIFGWIKPALLPTDGIHIISDRIYSQMRYVPPHYRREEKMKNKLILFYNGGREWFDGSVNDCPVKHCEITTNTSQATESDVVIWIPNDSFPAHIRRPGQIWAFLILESPEHTRNFKNLPRSSINWTLTYRPDSTIPIPYNFYSPYDLVNRPPERYPTPTKNYATGKTQMIAIFVSNCHAANDRLEIVKELNKYIPVHIYGNCGNFRCPRSNESDCYKILDSTYKFYLAFENSYCRHYITEKFFRNGLNRDVVPVVLGAHPDDYKRVAPPYSYIHVEDFDSIQDLALYLNYLDRNDKAYNEYFSWKAYGTAIFDQSIFCRICMMSHESKNFVSYYDNLYNWWHGEDGKMCFKKGRWSKLLNQ